MRTTALAMLVLLGTASGCTSIHTVRLQPDAVDVGPEQRPIAGIQADAISAYVLFIPLPGVTLDKAVNQMLIVAAKTMGADKVTQLRFSIDPEHGIWAWRKILGWRSARASGIAVQVTGPPADPGADDGPEPAGAPGDTSAPTPDTAPPATDPAPPGGA